MKSSYIKSYFYLSAILVALITLLIYLPALQNGFVGWDDNLYVFENRFIQSTKFEIFKWLITKDFFLDWHPVTALSFAIDYSLWGLHPFPYHLTSLILHAGNSLLLFFLAVILFKSSSPVPSVPDNKHIIAALLASILFAIHPMNVEAVAWISGRKDLLSAFFFLLTLLAFCQYAASRGYQKKFLYLSSLLFFTMALMSKPVAVTLPLVLILLDIYPLNRLTLHRLKRGEFSIVIEKVPFMLLSIVISIKTIYSYYALGTIRSIDAVSFLDRILLAMHACGFYLYKMILPLRLAPYYPTPDGDLLFSAKSLITIFLLLLIATITIISLKRTRVMAVICIYFLVTLLPVSGLVQSGIPHTADRYFYLPGISFILLAGLVSANAITGVYGKRWRVLITAFLIIVTLSWTAITRNQIAVWRDTLTLWSHEISLFPDSVAVAYVNRGNEYTNRGKYELALKDLNRAVEIDPAYAPAFNNRGNAYFSLDRYKEALSDYSRALDIDSELAEAYYNRGNVYNLSGDADKAIDDFNSAIKIDSKYPEAFNNRGIAYDNLGEIGKAIKSYQRAVELAPDYGAAYYNLGLTYLRAGMRENAYENLKKAGTLGVREAKEYLE